MQTAGQQGPVSKGPCMWHWRATDDPTLRPLTLGPPRGRAQGMSEWPSETAHRHRDRGDSPPAAWAPGLASLGILGFSLRWRGTPWLSSAQRAQRTEAAGSPQPVSDHGVAAGSPGTGAQTGRGRRTQWPPWEGTGRQLQHGLSSWPPPCSGHSQSRVLPGHPAGPRRQAALGCASLQTCAGPFLSSHWEAGALKGRARPGRASGKEDTSSQGRVGPTPNRGRVRGPCRVLADLGSELPQSRAYLRLGRDGQQVAPEHTGIWTDGARPAPPRVRPRPAPHPAPPYTSSVPLPGPVRAGVLLHVHTQKGLCKVAARASGFHRALNAARQPASVPSSGCGFLSPTCTMVLL